MQQIEPQLERLRTLWKHAPAEERHAINVTGKALKNGEAPDTVKRRIAAHERRFSKNKYEV
jgi:hypothetical protein